MTKDPQKLFDNAFREHLGKLPDGPVTGWDALAERLDASATAVDEVVAEKIRETATSAPSGWAQLAARLELIGRRRELLIALTITEIALLLSGLLLFARFGPETPPRLALSSFTVAESSQLMTALPQGDLEADLVGVATDLTTAEPKRVGNSVRSTSVATVVPPLVSTIPAVVTPTEELVVTVKNNNGALPIGTVLALSGRDIAPLGESSLSLSPAVHLPKFRDPERTTYALNAFFSPFDFNPVLTPSVYFDNVEIREDRRLTYGKSGGILVDVQSGKKGIQTGLIVSRKSYVPTSLRWLNQTDGVYQPEGPFQGGYDRLRFTSVTLPFGFTRDVVSAGDWRLSTRFGALINVMVESDFSADPENRLTLERVSSRFTPSPYPNKERPSTGREVNGDEYSLVNPEPGWWQGGEFLDNARIEVGGGIQVEKLLDEKWSIYVAPSFSRTIYVRSDAGVGPYFDRLHSYSLRFGSRYLLTQQ